MRAAFPHTVSLRGEAVPFSVPTMKVRRRVDALHHSKPSTVD